ncbi:MAG TPA: MFS transporter [Methylocella sp.]|nr:MFS transporter [Methylocella sp.]
MPLIYPQRLRGWRFVLFNAVLGLGHVVVVSNVGGYAVLIPYVAGSLRGVLPSFALWANTDFMVGLAIGFPISRWLAGRYGDYRLFIAAFFVYALAAFLCAISESLWLFLPSRIALGFAGGISLPVGQAMLLNEYPERKRPLGLSIWGMFTLMPFTVGIPLAGWLNEHLGWRYLFYSDVADALIVASVTGALLYGRGVHRRITRFDGGGFILLVVILLGTQTIFNQGNDFDWFGWSWLMFGLLVAVIAALPCFAIWEMAERHPVLDIRLFAHRNYAVAAICSMLGFLSIQGLFSIFVTQAQLLLGYSSSLAGLIFMAMIPFSVPLIAVAHKLCEGHDARFVASLNLLGLSFMMLWIGIFDDPSYFDRIFWPFLFLGFFLATFFAPLGVLALHGLPAARLLHAAEEFALLRTAAGAFGIALQGVVQFRRAPFHQLDLADHFGGRRFPSLDLLGQLTAKLEAAGLTPAMTQGTLGELIKEKAALLGLNDAFLLASFIFVLLAVFVWLARPTHVAYASRAERLRELRATELTEQP